MRLIRSHRALAAAVVLSALGAATTIAPAAGVDIQYSIPSPGSFTAQELQILNAALAQSKQMWETVLTGYQPGISIAAVPISIQPATTGLAAAAPSGTSFQAGYWLATSGFIQINVNEIENFASWQGSGSGGQGQGLNFIDELLEHETGHVLGIGTLWDDNGLYVNNTFQYTGAHGLAAYRAEFNPAAAFIPVENAGNPGTPNSHWDQRMRSSSQEGNPSDPWSLDPRVGITDALGRDQAFELMTGAIDPDWGEPFLSNTTVQSMRDLGYTVAPIPEPALSILAPVAAAVTLAARRRPR